MIWHIDPVNGNDIYDGLTWASAKKSMKAIPTGSVSAGDEVRFAKSPDPFLVGSATWTQNSNTVTVSNSLTTAHFVSRSSLAYWDSFPWHGIQAINGSTITLKRKYRGPTGSFPLYARLGAVNVVANGVVAHGWGSTGGSSVNGTSSNPITISGGWDTAINAQNGQTFLDGRDGTGVPLRIHGAYNRISRFSYARYNFPSLDQFVMSNGQVEIDNVIENTGLGVVVGSGIFTTLTSNINAICGNGGDGCHIHTAYNLNLTFGKVLDNFYNGLSQNNDNGLNGNKSNSNIICEELAWNGSYGVGNFNFAGGCNVDLGILHDNTLGGAKLDSSWAWYDEESGWVIVDQTSQWTVRGQADDGFDFGSTVGVDTTVGTVYIVNLTGGSIPVIHTSDTTVVWGSQPTTTTTSAPTTTTTTTTAAPTTTTTTTASGTTTTTTAAPTTTTTTASGTTTTTTTAAPTTTTTTTTTTTVAPGTFKSLSIDTPAGTFQFPASVNGALRVKYAGDIIKINLSTGGPIRIKTPQGVKSLA